MIDLSSLGPEKNYNNIAGAIEQQILAGAVVPGDALPSELSLAGTLGVHRSTIREAIRLLEQKGLVGREPGRKKLLVSIPGSAHISKTIANAMVLDGVTVLELWEAMDALEPAAAAGAARRVDEVILEALDANLEATRKALGDNLSLIDLDIEFHDLIAKAAQNRAIYVARRPLSEFFYPAFYGVMSRLNAGPRLLAAHEHIVEGIREGDERKAHLWMGRHIMDFRRGCELANLDINLPIERPSHVPAMSETTRS